MTRLFRSQCSKISYNNNDMFDKTRENKILYLFMFTAQNYLLSFHGKFNHSKKTPS